MTSLYLHIPFCRSKCLYCDFYSQVGSRDQLNEYVALLSLNLQLLKQQFSHSKPFETIFFGGGTPSLLSPGQIALLLNNIKAIFGINQSAEISLEANPGTVDRKQLEGYRQAGVNRLSLGIQSLNNQHLQLLGRIHSAEQARESVFAARAVGFDNLSLDLMFALPDQGLSALEQEISSLLELNSEHISLYGLSFEEGTEFTARLKRGELTACEDSHYADQYRLLHERMSDAGFEHYEISNFARPGYRCRHNQVYWQRRGCLAIGCGAHSFIEDKWGERWHIPTDLNRYRESLLQEKSPAELLESYDYLAAMKEFIYLGLRTSDGIDPLEFARRFTQQPEKVFPIAFNKTSRQLCLFNNRWRFDLDGWLLYDYLISHFL